MSSYKLFFNCVRQGKVCTNMAVPTGKDRRFIRMRMLVKKARCRKSLFWLNCSDSKLVDNSCRNHRLFCEVCFDFWINWSTMVSISVDDFCLPMVVLCSFIGRHVGTHGRCVCFFVDVFFHLPTSFPILKFVCFRPTMAGTCLARPAVIGSLPGSWSFHTVATLEPATSITALSPVMNCWRLLPRMSNGSLVFLPTTTPTTMSSLQLFTGPSAASRLCLKPTTRVFPATCPTVQSPASMVLGPLLGRPKSMTSSTRQRSSKQGGKVASHLQSAPSMRMNCGSSWNSFVPSLHSNPS